MGHIGMPLFCNGNDRRSLLRAPITSRFGALLLEGILFFVSTDSHRPPALWQENMGI